jgi:hypothetical protein
MDALTHSVTYFTILLWAQIKKAKSNNLQTLRNHLVAEFACYHRRPSLRQNIEKGKNWVTAASTA